jgi:predicted peptidase
MRVSRSLVVRSFLLMVFAMSLSTASAADKKVGTFLTKQFKNTDDTMSPYVVFVPHGHDKSKPTPILLFLHGAGETKGTKGGMMPVEQGLAPHIKRMEEKGKPFPFLVVIPQAEAVKTQVPGRWHPENPDGKRALAMLDEVSKEYNADAKKTYLTGLSMGGFGTWAIAAKYPERWAAIAPICGGGEAAWAEKLKDLPCWCFHGAEDRVVPAKLSRDMIEAIKTAGGKPRYSELPFVGHNSWDAAYAHEELFTWLLSHSKK